MSGADKHGFGELDTWFIDKYLRHKDETLEDAKVRIAADEEQKKQKNFQNSASEPKTQTKL